MNSNNPLVSIIVPVYNTAPDLLTKCINSIKNQTYTNFECLIIDDGSGRETASFLDTLADSHIKIIHQENKGVSEARNTGIMNVNGEYFTFIDADDSFSLNIIEKLVNAAEINKSDLCIAEFELISDSTGKRIGGAKNKYECTINVNDSNRLLLLQQTFHYVSSRISLITEPYECSTKDLWLQGKVWGKLYRTDCYKKERFVREVSVTEDALYFIDILKKCKKISFVQDAYVYYCINDGSVSRGKITCKGRDLLFISMKKKLDEYSEVFEGMYSLLMFGLVSYVIQSNGFWKGYLLIKDFYHNPQISDINKMLSMNGVSNSQEKRTRNCLRHGYFLLLAVIAKISMVKGKLTNKMHK